MSRRKLKDVTRPGSGRKEYEINDAEIPSGFETGFKSPWTTWSPSPSFCLAEAIDLRERAAVVKTDSRPLVVPFFTVRRASSVEKPDSRRSDGGYCEWPREEVARSSCLSCSCPCGYLSASSPFSFLSGSLLYRPNTPGQFFKEITSLSFCRLIFFSLLSLSFSVFSSLSLLPSRHTELGISMETGN